MEKYFDQFENCREKEEPACTNACPFKFDVKSFQDKIKKNKYDRAYKIYRDSVVFPEIVSRFCEAPCQAECPRKGFDGSVQIKLLERTCTVKAKKKEPSKYTLPKKDKKIGIIGAGLSGLACGLRLAAKKYDVVIFEKEATPGGQLRSLMPEDEYLEVINLQMSNEEYELITGMEVTTPEQLKMYDFDAVYIATGHGGKEFIFHDIREGNYIPDYGFAVWHGGAICGKNLVESIVDGTNAASAIDLYLKTGKGEIADKKILTKVVPNISKMVECQPVMPTDNGVFSDEETVMEAERCIRCQCDSCWSTCDMVSYYNKWPGKMREEIAETVMESGSMLRKSPATYLVNTCTQCGLFEDSCPANIDMKGMMLQTRRILHKQGQLPPAFHGFWLDDMEHANGPMAAICKNAPGSDLSEYAFFPGCNLGASRPDYVNNVYGWLIENFSNVGLMLRCCGIHAEWAGDEQLSEKLLDDLRRGWRSLGCPIIIATCPSCIRFLKENSPEMTCISLYEFMCEKGQVPSNMNTGTETFAIFDSCAARKNVKMREAIRTVLKKTSIKTIELKQEGGYGCCGAGGDITIASPEFAKYIADKRASMSEAPYITYCINCRDVFADIGKPAVHVLDILFMSDGIVNQVPDFNDRRRNREILKKDLLECYWGEHMIDANKKYEFKIITDDEVRKKMKRIHLVEEDVKEVISRANQFNRRIYNSETGEYTCYSKLNYITCWVRYVMEDDEYRITNVYTHRMDIKLEEVWNGKKVKSDL